MVFRKYTLGRYRETITMIKIQTTIKKSERTVVGLRPSSGLNTFNALFFINISHAINAFFSVAIVRLQYNTTPYVWVKGPQRQPAYCCPPLLLCNMCCTTSVDASKNKREFGFWNVRRRCHGTQKAEPNRGGTLKILSSATFFLPRLIVPQALRLKFLKRDNTH